MAYFLLFSTPARFLPPAGANCSEDARQICAALLEDFFLRVPSLSLLCRKTWYMQMGMQIIAGDGLK
jgi:hypothetical protein